MAKFILGARPKSFKHKVEFPLIEGGVGEINCEFVYRTKSEFADFIDAQVDAGKLAQEVAQDIADGEIKPATIGKFFKDSVKKNGEYLMDILTGWDVEGFPLSAESATQLADEAPGGAAAIMVAYRNALVEGRLGN